MSLIAFVVLVAATLCLLAWRVLGTHTASAWRLMQIAAWLVAIAALVAVIFRFANRIID